MCFLAFILREVEEGAGLLELECTFFGGALGGRSCCWVMILSSNSSRFPHSHYQESPPNGREVCDKYKLNVDILKWNQKTFGNKSLKALGPKI